MKKYPIKVGIIGYGHLGKWHAEKANLLANLSYIIEQDESKHSAIQAKYPLVRISTRVSDMLGKIDAAIIVTPTSTHFPLLGELSAMNVHIFCEKPIVANLNEASALSEKLARYNKVIQVGHSERFHESWNILQRYQRYLAPPSVIRINRYAPFKNRASDVDVVTDLMIHDLDLLSFILKEEPVLKDAFGFKIRTSNWDYVSAQFTFGSGHQALVVASRNHVKEVRDLEIFSKEGCLYVDLFHHQILTSSTSPNQSSDGSEVIKLEFQKRDHLFLEQQHFYESIAESLPPIVDLKAGIDAVKLISHVKEKLDFHESHPR